MTKLIPWEYPHAAFLFCFIRFGRVPGNRLDSLGNERDSQLSYPINYVAIHYLFFGWMVVLKAVNYCDTVIAKVQCRKNIDVMLVLGVFANGF